MKRSIMDEPKYQDWVQWHRTYNLIMKCEEASFVETELTPAQCAVLLGMRYIKGNVTPTDIVQWTDRSPSSVSAILDRMEDRGLIKRTRDRQDRRAVRLATTRKGKDSLDRALQPWMELIHRLTSCFSDEEMETFSQLMARLREQALNELGDEEPTEAQSV